METYVEAGKAGSINIHVHDDEAYSFENHLEAEPVQSEPDPVQWDATRIFALAERSAVPFPERYPRLTLSAITLLLLLSSLTAEFEYLRGAGYSWPWL
jgi:hypothetical protein